MHKMRMLLVQASPDLYKKLSDMARDNNITISEAVYQAVFEFLTNHSSLQVELLGSIEQGIKKAKQTAALELADTAGQPERYVDFLEAVQSPSMWASHFKLED